MHPRTVSTAALAIVLLAGTAGCASDGGPDRGACVSRFAVSPERAAPGETVTLSSEDICETASPADGWTIDVGHVGDGDPVFSVTTVETFDGLFRFELTLPPDFPAGEAYAGVADWDTNDCADNGSCASPSATFHVAD